MKKTHPEPKEFSKKDVAEDRREGTPEGSNKDVKEEGNAKGHAAFLKKKKKKKGKKKPDPFL